MDQLTFKRYEIKYIITTAQAERLKQYMLPYMTTNKYSFSTIRNIYYDTDDYKLIRTSLSKPLYKEKLRLRCYSRITQEDNVFVELKKKFDSVVYKRRLALPDREAVLWLGGDVSLQPASQIGREIAHFVDCYPGLRPAMYLSYDRAAYQGIEDPEFRLTFDRNILARTNRLDLCREPQGEYVIDPDLVVMEIKVAGAFPLWITHFLAKEHIYQSSFSKYGTAYRNMLSTIEKAA